MESYKVHKMQDKKTIGPIMASCDTPAEAVRAKIALEREFPKEIFVVVKVEKTF